MGNTGGSGQGVLPELRLTILSGTLLNPDPSKDRRNPNEASNKDPRLILIVVIREVASYGCNLEVASYGCNLNGSISGILL
eukprot:9858532-Ditylum_brightwellii.AAC.1